MVKVGPFKLNNKQAHLTSFGSGWRLAMGSGHKFGRTFKRDSAWSKLENSMDPQKATPTLVKNHKLQFVMLPVVGVESRRITPWMKWNNIMPRVC